MLLMGVIDWLKQAATNTVEGAKWLGQTVSKGTDWLHENIVKPIGDIGQPLAEYVGAGELWGKGRTAVSKFNDLQNRLLRGKGGPLTADDIKQTVDSASGAANEYRDYRKKRQKRK